MVESKGVEHACSRQRVTSVNIIAKVFLVEVSSACLDQANRGLLVSTAVALEGARGANKLQRVIPIRMLDVQTNKALNQDAGELVTQVRKIAHGVHRVADIALRCARDAGLELW